MLNIAILDYDTIGYDINIDRFKDFGNISVYGHTTYEQSIQRIKDIDIVITNKVVIDQNIMDNTNIKLICVAATGMNNIDLSYAKEKNIVVKNVAGYSTNSVVQLTFTFVLNFIQKFDYYTQYVSTKEWEKSHIFVNLDRPFVELCGKKWGIIGFGTIGQNVASIAKAFGCEIYYYSTTQTNLRQNATHLNLDKLLSTCDIITIHAPLNPSTHNLIGAKQLELLKEKAILINVGRGNIINEQDLAQYLDKKEIYVGLDVISTEPISSQNPLNFIQNKDRLKITPHIGWASVEARNRLTQGILQNISDFVLEYKL